MIKHSYILLSVLLMIAGCDHNSSNDAETPVDIHGPDLVVLSTDCPDSLVNGNSVAYNVVVKNIGDQPAQACDLTIYFNPPYVAGPSLQFGNITYPIGAIGPGDTLIIQMPFATDNVNANRTYTLTVDSGAVVIESNEGNNSIQKVVVIALAAGG